MNAPLRGASLQQGDTIGIVAPASGFDRDLLERGTAYLESLGYRVKLGAHVYDREPQYFAGKPQQRVSDLHAMFADSSVRAILCARGGYGSQTLLPLLDLELVRKNPKPIIGCSDLTALQLWLYDHCGLVSLHGPMAAGDFAREGGIDIDSWNACLGGDAAWQIGPGSGITTLRHGHASGILYGGCLSLLVATLATPLELLTDASEDFLLFVEDVAEKPYKIERMFSQWRDAGKLRHVKGIVFGEMLNCEQPNSSYKFTDVLSRMLADFPGPVAYGLRSGHVSAGNVTLPIGVQADLHCAALASITIQQAATVAA